MLMLLRKSSGKFKFTPFLRQVKYIAENTFYSINANDIAFIKVYKMQVKIIKYGVL